jgi:hypothetical protein
MTLPEDLVDQRSAASVNVPLTTVGNGLAYLNEVITVRRNVPRSEGITAETWARTVQPQPYAVISSQRIGRDRFPDVNTGANEGKHMYFSLNPFLIDGATLVSATAYVNATGTGHLGLPAYMPAMTAMVWDSAAPLAYDLKSTGFTVDSSANVAAFEARHTIVSTFDQNNTISLQASTGLSYWLVLVNEGGANAQSSFTVDAVILTLTAPRHQT